MYKYCTIIINVLKLCSVLLIRGCIMDYKHVGRLIRNLSNIFDKEFNKVALKYDLTTSQSMVLIYLQKNTNQETNPIDLEKHFNYSHASILGILKRLEEKKFITISKSDKDKRFRIIKISEKGINTEKNIKKSLKQVIDRLYVDINDNEKDIFINILHRMIYNLKEDKEC